MIRVRFVLLLCVAVVAGCRVTIGTIVNRYGYSELRPPSTLPAPGTLVRLRSVSPVSLGIVCTSSEAFGLGLQVLPSASIEMALTQELNRGAKLDANYMKRIRANVAFADVRDISVHFANVHVFEVSDANVFTNVEHRAPGCSQAKSAREQDGAQVTLIRSVIQADVDYVVRFNRKLDTAVQAEITKDIAADLGISTAELSNTTIRGKALYWGVIDDAFLGRVNRPGEPATSPPRRRLIAKIASIFE